MTDDPRQPDAPAPPDPRPPSEQPDAPAQTTRSLVGDMLAFTGPIVAAGGLLAMIRLWQWDWFFAAFLPVGVAMHILGKRWQRRDG